MITDEMILSFCDDLSDWMLELGDTDLTQAAPHMKVPLRNHVNLNDRENEWEQLFYLTFWMCLKHRTKAPDHIESRLMLTGKGIWPNWYLKFVERLNKPSGILSCMWDLAG